jgi:hypothetical protein
LSCNTTYHYSIYGKDGSANESTLADATFTTAACTVTDTQAPFVVTATPSNGATSVSAAIGVADIEFNEAYNTTTLNESKITMVKVSDGTNVRN